uniref:Uncharacterized protein n=1 Tax=Anguilla anguilla TaxID=7936 RepID=A0A0E9QTK9_ANGAN
MPRQMPVVITPSPCAPVTPYWYKWVLLGCTKCLPLTCVSQLFLNMRKKQL